MKFKNSLSQKIQENVEVCDSNLKNPARLRAVELTRLMDTPKDVSFDRLAKMAAVVLKVPVTIISIIGEKKQFFKADYGLKAPYDLVREVPIDDSICRYTLAGNEIVAADTSTDDLLKNHPTTGPWGITAFLSIPMITTEGHVIGSFCAIDSKIHSWSDDDLSIMRELTTAVMTEIQLLKQVEDMTIERRMREQFVAALSHDLRNPIGVAIMSAEILSEDGIESNERRLLVKMIRENMERADSMISDLLNVTFIKSGEKMQIKPTKNNMKQILNSTIENMSKLSRHAMVLNVSDDLEGYWDALGIRRILENLIGNGVKYGSLTTPITVSCRTIDRMVSIDVHNEGNPILPNMLESIFEPFKRSDSAKRSAQKGWGIGLTLVKGLVEAHHGNISVISNAEVGTTFSVKLPIDFRSLDS